MTGYSLHIGLNYFDPQHYGNDGRLKAAVADAASMKTIAQSLGYQYESLINEHATAGAVCKQLANLSSVLKTDDILLLTYAGHGAQVFDRQGLETDGLDETWCLFDRMLLDDELFNLFSYFRTGVRIFVISDSCHSGTVVRGKQYDPINQSQNSETLFRGLVRETTQVICDQNQSLYDAAKYTSFRGESSKLDASVELFSGCQDNQLSLDGSTNGYFTERLIEVWDDGKFDGTHSQFFRAIRSEMPPWQTPNRVSMGPTHHKFKSGKPFEH